MSVTINLSNMKRHKFVLACGYAANEGMTLTALPYGERLVIPDDLYLFVQLPCEVIQDAAKHALDVSTDGNPPGWYLCIETPEVLDALRRIVEVTGLEFLPPAGSDRSDMMKIIRA